MAEQILKDCKLWIDGYDFSGDMNALQIAYGADTPENTTFGNDTHTMIGGGLKTVSMAHSGFVNTGTGNVDDYFFNQMAVTNKAMSISPEAGADGDRAFTMLGLLGSYNPGGSVGDIMSFDVAAQAEGNLIRGKVMHNASRSTSGNGTARQLGAVSASQKVYAALHVLSCTGTLDVVIQSDALVSMGSPTAQITFNQSTGIDGQFLSAAGAITDDWWRVNYTVTGTAEFVVIIGIGD